MSAIRVLLEILGQHHRNTVDHGVTAATSFTHQLRRLHILSQMAPVDWTHQDGEEIRVDQAQRAPSITERILDTALSTEP